MPRKPKPPPPPTPPPPPPPPPEYHTGWTQYGADAQHTFAVEAAVSGLTPLYRHAAPGGIAHHALLTDDGVAFFRSGDGAQMERLDPMGVRVWQANVGIDYNPAYWPALVWGYLLAHTDGVHVHSLGTGARVRSGAYVDVWGNVTVDPGEQLVYVPNVIHFDGLSCCVVAYRNWGIAWKALNDSAYSHYLRDRAGGGNVVADGSRLWYSPRYEPQAGAVPTPLVSGVYCLSLSGTILWSHPTRPHGNQMLADGRLYLVERAGPLTTNGVPIPAAVVCRSAETGEVVWSVETTAWSEVDHGVHQAPVWAGDRVLVTTAAGLEAFALADGHRCWAAPLQMPGVSQLYVAGEPGGWRPAPVEQMTTACYAEQTDTVIVTCDAGVALVDGRTGQARAIVPIAGAVPPLHDPVLVPDMLVVCDASSLIALSVNR